MSAPMPPTPPSGSGSAVPPANAAAQPPVPATPVPPPAPVTGSAGATSAAPAAPTAGPSSAAAKAPLEPLTGFRASLEHTGLPRGVLTWKPRLPSRNWLIFWSVVGSVSYLYYDDRRKCRLIKADYISRVERMGQEPMVNALAMPRKVTVWAAKWPEDDDADRGARYFRKYVKPYLVAAGIDFTYPKNPIYGSVTRQVRSLILRQRREALGLQEPAVAALNLPVMQDGRTEMQRDADGGVVVVGRASLKEYLEGVKRGWSNGVSEWNWEKEIEEKLKHDGVFESAPEPVLDVAADSAAAAASDAAAPAKAGGLSGLSFLSRGQAPSPGMPSPTSGPFDPSQPPAQPAIPAHMHAAPNPLPPTAPVLLLPFISHTGFKQIPYMIFDFFTEHRRVKAGAEAAYALIMGQTRPFVPAAAASTSAAATLLDDPAAAAAASETAAVQQDGSDLTFDTDAERYYKKDFKKLPARIEKARTEYYKTLADRLASVRALANGEREMTDEEKKSAKGPETEDELKAERLKKELRWMGQLEGWEIVRPETPVTWDDKWDGWLKVYEAPAEGAPKAA